MHLRADELPPGRLVVSVTHHLTAVIDGVIHDTHDPSRGGTRCVYGVWTEKPVPPSEAKTNSEEEGKDAKPQPNGTIVKVGTADFTGQERKQ